MFLGSRSVYVRSPDDVEERYGFLPAYTGFTTSSPYSYRRGQKHRHKAKLFAAKRALARYTAFANYLTVISPIPPDDHFNRRSFINQIENPEDTFEVWKYANRAKKFCKLFIKKGLFKDWFTTKFIQEATEHFGIQYVDLI